ncbi:hypothetical protein GCM10023184_13470 [Flaviaesturariibacter amylovorans]|uniref:Carboxypeptidase regulatory-like domain-containing protein n=1 Tax=Flaviaesturariibacter amylovorans TaxID=1084520 RepID=A0ABP8GJE8_9BACT
MAFDTTAAGVSVIVTDLETKVPLLSQMLLIRGGDTLVGWSDKIGVLSVMQEQIDGNWDLHVSSEGYRCFIVSDVPVRGGRGQTLRVRMRKLQARVLRKGARGRPGMPPQAGLIARVVRAGSPVIFCLFPAQNPDLQAPSTNP